MVEPPLDHAARFHVGERGAREAAQIDAAMVLEAAVLDGDERVADMVGKLRGVDFLDRRRPAARDDAAVAGEEGEARLAAALARAPRGDGHRLPCKQEDEHRAGKRIAQRAVAQPRPERLA